MSGAIIHIAPPLTCGACGALVDERQAWHRWPHHMPQASGNYQVLLQRPDTMIHLDIASWNSKRAGWFLINSCHVRDAWPLAWRHLPPLPEWIT